jgi:hypothetical protein
MASDNVGSKRKDAPDEEVPAEMGKREAQDRSGGGGDGKAQSPVDSLHVDAPKKQDNARGHRRKQ